MKKLEDIIAEIPEPPKELINSHGDLVSWDAKSGEGKSLPADTACYASLMRHLAEATIECFPYPRGGREYPGLPDKGKRGDPLIGRLSPFRYTRVMRNFRRAGILPEAVEYYSDPERGNCLRIPGGKYDRHTTYMLLNFYRIIDSRPGGIWKILALQDALRKGGYFLPFLQVFFYVLNEPKESLRTQHCTPITGYYAKGSLLGRAWAFSKFYHMSPEERKAKAFIKQIQTDKMWEVIAGGVDPGGGIDSTGLLRPEMKPVFTHPERFGKEELSKLVEKK